MYGWVFNIGPPDSKPGVLCTKAYYLPSGTEEQVFCGEDDSDDDDQR